MRHICKTGLLLCFYPRHPRGWRQTSFGLAAPTPLFLSTPPSRVATWRYNLFADRDSGFYPRHPRGWRHGQRTPAEPRTCFYPRHPRGWRLSRNLASCRADMFLSTPPSRVATSNASLILVSADVSIHATLAGGDVLSAALIRPFVVSIHATLAGGDLFGHCASHSRCAFLSTPPSRVATARHSA